MKILIKKQSGSQGSRLDLIQNNLGFIMRYENYVELNLKQTN